MIKNIILLLWAIILSALIIPYPGNINSILTWLGIAMLVAHLLEFFLYKKVIDAKGDGFMKSFAMTMVYGAGYIKGAK